MVLELGVYWFRLFRLFWVCYTGLMFICWLTWCFVWFSCRIVYYVVNLCLIDAIYRLLLAALFECLIWCLLVVLSLICWQLVFVLFYCWFLFVLLVWFANCFFGWAILSVYIIVLVVIVYVVFCLYFIYLFIAWLVVVLVCVLICVYCTVDLLVLLKISGFWFYYCLLCLFCFVKPCLYLWLDVCKSGCFGCCCLDA